MIFTKRTVSILQPTPPAIIITLFWSIQICSIILTHWSLGDVAIVSTTLTPKSLARRDGEIVDPEIAVKLEMQDVLNVHGPQT